MSDWLFLVLAAPFVGSFLGVLATRFFSKRSIIFGRSKCPSCNHRLAPRDLVPIASWIFHRRRCQYCSAPIAFFYPLMEIGALLVAVSAVSLFSGWLIWVSCAFGWVLLVIAAIDYQHMILPDELTVPLIPAGLGIAYILNPYDLVSHVIGVGAGFATFWVVALLYRWLRGREGLGLGDAKFLAASGAWVSFSGLPSVVFLGAATALLVVLGAMVAGRRFSSFDPLPFGLYLCLGTWLVWLFGPLFRS